MLRPGGQPVYMIVALLIWTGATFAEARALSKSRGVGGTLPVSTAASLAGVGTPIDVGDPELGRTVDEARKRNHWRI